MHRRPRRRAALTIVAVTAGLMVTAGPVGAITFGTPDTTGRYANVGSLVLTVPDGGMYQLCTGTLIAPTVVLTASHCLVAFPEDFEISVTFDAVIDADQDGLVDDDVTLLAGTSHAHPLFASGGANNTYDIGVVVLDEPVAGVPVAPLPRPRSARHEGGQERNVHGRRLWDGAQLEVRRQELARARMAAGVRRAVDQLGHQELGHALDEPLHGQRRDLLRRLGWTALQRRRSRRVRHRDRRSLLSLDGQDVPDGHGRRPGLPRTVPSLRHPAAKVRPGPG